MGKETFKEITSIQRDFQAQQSSSTSFDLPILIEEMKHSYSWMEGELNAMILLNKPNKQIVLTSFQKGIKIKSFQSNDSITFQTVEGKLKLHTHERLVVLEKGQHLALNENIGYSLTTDEKTVFLTTIASSTIQLEGNQTA